MISSLLNPQSVPLGQPGQLLLTRALSNKVYFKCPLLSGDAKLLIISLWKPQSVQSGQLGQLLLASAVSSPVYWSSPLLSFNFDNWTWKRRTWIISTKSYCRVVFYQRANRIHVCDLWWGSIWYLDLKVQEINYLHKVILQSSFESKSKQDSYVWLVTRGSIWHLDLKV